jgi:hypothetical protein
MVISFRLKEIPHYRESGPFSLQRVGYGGFENSGGKDIARPTPVVPLSSKADTLLRRNRHSGCELQVPDDSVKRRAATSGDVEALPRRIPSNAGLGRTRRALEANSRPAGRAFASPCHDVPVLAE